MHTILTNPSSFAALSPGGRQALQFSFFRVLLTTDLPYFASSQGLGLPLTIFMRQMNTQLHTMAIPATVSSLGSDAPTAIPRNSVVLRQSATT
jgi:hypothetical protein